MGITTKRIKGVDYLYFTDYDKGAGTTKNRSCGPAHTRRAQLKAARLECARLDTLAKETVDAADKLRCRIRELEEGGPET